MNRPLFAKIGLSAPALVYLALLCVAPLLIVADFSIRDRDYHGQVRSTYSLKAWREALGNETLRPLARSLALSLAVTLASLAAGYPCALAMVSISERRRRWMVVLISFPLITSLLLRIYGWLNLLPLEWKGSWTAVGLVMTINYLPFMILPILRSLERAEPNVLAAALDLGATPWQAFWRVTWPLTRPGVWAGGALVFIPCCGEYLVPHFIGQGKVTVIGGLIFKGMDSRNWPYAAACAVWLAMVILFPIIVSLLGNRRQGEPA